MADDKDITDEDQAAGGKKKLIIIAAAVLLLLVAGAAAFFLMGGDEEASADVDKEDADEVAVEEADPTYHKLDPTFIVSLPPGGPADTMQVAIEIMTRTPSVITTLKTNDPMIRHHLINLLEGQQAADLLTKQGKESLQAAIGEMLAEKLEALGERGEIKGVFFTQFVLQ